VRGRGHAGRLAADADAVGRVAAARALGVVGVDRPTPEGADRVLDEPRLVERVGVDRDLHVVLVRDRQRAVDRGGRRPPVLMELEPDRSRGNLLAEGLGRDRKSTRLNSSHEWISYAVFCLKKKKKYV